MPKEPGSWSARGLLRALQVRLRFVIVLAAVFVVVGKWDSWQGMLTRLGPLGEGARTGQAIAGETEYFCPMCPGVLSEWPNKCPVCNMALVSRKKGEMPMLPNGVIARMQLSPYRIQLAGIQTQPAAYESLWLEQGGEPRKSITLAPEVRKARHSRQQITAASFGCLELVTGIFDDSQVRRSLDLLSQASDAAAWAHGAVLSIPDSAVIETGTRQLVYLETAPGQFDAVEVWLGPRCGSHFPVLAGIEPGQKVVVVGAFLLDAETQLNPALAAGYFGASRPRQELPVANVASKNPAKALSDASAIALQKLCPVTGAPLDSMGGPVKVIVENRPVFLCCEGCEGTIRKQPEKYLAKLRSPSR